MKTLWSGRYDGDEEIDLRLWQVIREAKEMKENSGYCFIGYDTDEGVRRNNGRVGAKDGSDSIRKAMGSFPKIDDLEIYDFGNLSNKITEAAQEEYSNKVAEVIKKGNFPIGLGGGHDIAYGSYLGIRKAYPDKKIGLINFDTHLDIRPYSKERTSGTSFKEILDHDNNVLYSIVGYKSIGNTKRLIETAKEFNTLILDENQREDFIIESLKKYCDSVDIVYVTFCVDVFDANYAPGVSAPTVLGLDPRKGERIFQEILKTKKVVCVDFAEVNPVYDIDKKTAKLVGVLIYNMMLNSKK